MIFISKYLNCSPPFYVMGKARSFSDAANDTVYQTETNSENYTMGQQNTYNLGSVHFTDQSGIGNFSQAGSDQRKASLSGALFLGNLGFDLQTVLLDTGTETIDLNNDSTGTVLSVISTDRFVTLDSGTTGTLTTITGPQRPGQRLRLYNTTTNTITITHTAAATVNTIRTPDGTDLTFPGNGVLDLTFDITSAQWRVVGNVGGSGGGVSFPITPPVNELGTVSTNQDIDLSLDTAHSTTLTLEGDIDITFSNFPTSGTQIEWEIQVTQDATGGRVITWPTEVVNAPTLSTTADSITVVVLRTNDGGTTVRVANTVTTTAGATTLSGITIDIAKDWLNFGITNLGALSMVDQIDLAAQDLIGADRIQISGGTTSATSVDDVVWYLTGDPTIEPVSLVSNVGATDSWIWSSDNIIKMALTDSTLQKNNVTAPSFQLYNTRTEATGTAGTISILANTANTSTGVAMGFIIADTEVETTDGRGSLRFGVNIDGLPTEYLNLNEGNDEQVNILKEVDMTTNKIVNVVDPTAAQDAATKQYVDDTAGVQSSIEDGDSSVNVIDATPEITFILNASQVGEFSATAFLPSVPIDMTASITDPNIIGLGKLQFTENDDTLSASQTIITARDTDDLFYFNTGVVTDAYEFAFAGTSEWEFTQSTLQGPNLILQDLNTAVGGTLTLGDSTADPLIDGQFSKNGDILGLEIPEFAVRRTTTTGTDFVTLSLLKIDASPGNGDDIGSINFEIFDSPTTITYSQIRSEIKDATDSGSLFLSVRADNSSLQDALEIQGANSNARSYLNINSRITSDLAFGLVDETGSASLKISPLSAATELGIVVQDNASFTVGDEGTIAIPIVSSLTATAAAANTAFGDHDGAMGLLDTGAVLTLFIRQLDGDWGAQVIAGYGVLT